MATALFAKGREGFAIGGVNWTGDTIKALLVDADYVPNLATHDFVDDVTSTGRVGTISAAQTLGTKTATDGVCDAADVVFPGVTNATPVVGVVLYKDTGVESTSRLIAYIDNLAGLPLTPNGGAVTVAWDNGTNRIFKL